MGYYFFAVLVLIGAFAVEPTRVTLVLFGVIAAAMALAFKHARRDRESQSSVLDPAPRAASPEDWDPPFDDLMRR